MEDSILEKYAQDAVQLLEENCPSEWTEEDAIKLANELMDLDLEKSAEYEKVAEWDEQGRVMARGFMDELEKEAIYGGAAAKSVAKYVKGRASAVGRHYSGGRGEQAGLKGVLEGVKGVGTGAYGAGKRGVIAGKDVMIDQYGKLVTLAGIPVRAAAKGIQSNVALAKAVQKGTVSGAGEGAHLAANAGKGARLKGNIAGKVQQAGAHLAANADTYAKAGLGIGAAGIVGGTGYGVSRLNKRRKSDDS